MRVDGGDGARRPVVEQGTLVAGRYRVDAPLGAGGMSSVFAGHDAVLDRAVALKLLRRGPGAGERATQRLLREAKLTARILHAACVQVFDGGFDPHVGAFLVMELLRGQDLRRFLHARAPLPVPLALGLFEQICAIVQAVHQAGVVHRDLKPGNVFVVDAAPGLVPRVKLLDFGIAKAEPVDAEEAQLTEPGDLLGTLVYMAPERWQGASAPDVRGDVYALGALLHEMLSGHPSFHGDTKAALRLAILNDRPPSLLQARADVPVWLDAAVAGAMAKRPEDRPRDVAALAAALGLRASIDASPAAASEPAFAGTARFRVQRCLSRGPDTEVYAALDVEQNRLVALKRLAHPRGEAALRLKRDFRTVAEVRHPNLVRLEALWEERGELLMTMELVEGTPLLDHVAGSEQRLRSCLAQLALGLEALHARRLAHRDVKLENVIVDGAGRVVLLDGGLALGWCGRGARAGGTPAYVAPEALEGQVGPEGDLYAVGIILRAALSGEPPSADSGPLDLARPLGPPPDGPADLRDLCARLLAADPAARPTPRQVWETLRARGGEPAEAALPAPAAPELAPGRDAFVGRADALAALDAALDAVGADTPQVVWIEGESGIGKSALLEEFRRRLADRRDTVVLTGRARHGDAVPFPALDEVIDGLAAYLAGLPPSVAEVLLPKRASHVARLFPSLASVRVLARMPDEREATANVGEVRRLAFDSLRNLLARLGDSRRVVVLLDDVQWIDADSRALLAHLLGAAHPPALLVVGAARATAHGEELRKLDAVLGARVRRLELGPLGPDEARALVGARWRGREPLSADAARRLADDGRGVPFFLELLAVAARDRPDADGLDQVLAERIGALPERARRALELVCVAARPLPADVVHAAAAVDGLRELDALISERLVRWTRGERGTALEPYHDKTRDAVRAALPEGAARAHHRALAAALDRGSARDPELLIEHLARAGEAARATEIALAAARAANEQLAFDRAAALFAVAVEHGQFDEGARLALARERGRALLLARRRRECGEVLLRASQGAPDPGAAADLRREAGAHLMLSGDVGRGLEVLEPALARAGLRVPMSLEETIAATGAAMAALAGTTLAAPAPGATPAPDEVGRVELCLVLAQGLAHIDLRVLPFACEGLLAALARGEPRQLQRAAALFVINSVEYMPNPLVAPALALCRALTEAAPTPYARALFDAAVAEDAHFKGDFLEAESAFERAERTLLDACPEATRELAMVRDLAVFVQYAQKGDFATQLPRTLRWQAEADAAQDVYHASMLRVAHAIVWIAQDRPAHARAELRRAQEEWVGEAGVLEVGAALYHDIIDRYEELDPNREPEASARAALLRSPAASTPFLGGYLGLQQAWVALRALAVGTADAGAGAALVREIVARMRAVGLTIWSAIADVLEANLLFLEGEREPAVRGLDVAETRFRRAAMACLAACARRRRGELVAGELGERLCDEADAELAHLGVVNVPRWTRAYWSMYDAEAVRARTMTSATAETPRASTTEL